MSLDEVNTIVEGCMPNTPRSLMYSGIDLEIPKNVTIVLSDHEIHPERYLLYGKTKNFLDYEIINKPFFEFEIPWNDPSKLLNGGWPISKQIPNFRRIFDAQRSLTTRDGRIYIKALYFQEKWREYLDAVPTILRECGEIFAGVRDEVYFQNNPSAAW